MKLGTTSRYLDQLNNGHLSGIAAAGSQLVDAGIAAVLILVFHRDLIDNLFGNCFLGNIGIDLALGMEIGPACRW